MQTITLGQIASILAFLVAFISSLEYLYLKLKKLLKTALKEEIEPIKTKLCAVEEEFKTEQQAQRRNELMRFFSILKREGSLDENEKIHYHKNYDEYIAAGGDSYIEDLNDKYKNQGKL